VLLCLYLAAYSGGMALGAVLGPVVAAGPGWQGNFYLCAPIAVVLLFASWRFVHVDESKKVHEHDHIVGKEAPNNISTKAKKRHLDIIGIITMAVTLVSFLIAITFSGSIATDLMAFVIPLVIGIIFLMLFIFVEKRVKSPLVNLKLVFHPVIFCWKHHDVDVWYFALFRYHRHTTVRICTSTVWIRTKPDSHRTSTVGVWSINDDLWASFRVDGSKKKGT
jgi:MFS family permease